MAPAFQPTRYAIDFGTSNSLLAAARDDATHPPIPLDSFASDPTILRTLLYFPNSQRVHYGAEAIAEYIANDMQGRLLRSIKRFLPRKEFIGTVIDGRKMNMETLVGSFLGEMRRRANCYFDCDVRRVVLGRPARFHRDEELDRFAQERLERGARLAGFEHVDFCPEPVAAARDFRAGIDSPKIVLIADFGGGTSDFSVIRLHRDHYSDGDVMAIGGVPLAGDAFDAALMRGQISRNFGASVEYRVPLGANVMTMPTRYMEAICSPGEMAMLRDRDVQSLLSNIRRWTVSAEERALMDNLLCLVEDQLGFSVFESIENTKRQLSSGPVGVFEFDYPGLQLREEVSLEAFEGFSANTVKTIVDALDQTVKDAGVGYEAIDLVCCTGGTAKVSALAAAIGERVEASRTHQHKSFHSVIGGLADHAMALEGARSA